MILIGAIVVFVLVITIKSVMILKEDKFVNNDIERYIINPLYINTDIPIEKALEDFKIIKIGKRQ